MLSDQLAALLARRNIHYGWAVVAVTFLMMITTAGTVGLPGAFMQPFEREFGWHPDQISIAIAIRFVLFGLSAPFAAATMERYGLRKVIVAAIVMNLISLLSPLFVTSVWQLAITWGLIGGLASGMVALVLGAIIANRWFSARRGLVLGVLTASVSTGQLLFLPPAAWLITHVGWRYAIAPPAIAIVIAAALFILVIRERPQDVGLLPFGDTAATAPPVPTASTRNAFVTPFAVLWSVTASPTFWILFGTFFVCGLSTTGLIQTHFISLCADFGVPTDLAALTLAAMGVLDLFGTIGSGWLSDRFDSRKLLFWYYALRGLSLLYLPYSNFTVVGLGVFTIFYGLDWIATVPPTVRLAGQAFGREKSGIVFGWIFGGHQLGAAIAAYAGGLSRTWLASYLPAFFAAGALCVIAGVAALTISRGRADPFRRTTAEPAAA